MSNTTTEPTVITGEQLIREVRKLGRDHPDRTGTDGGSGCRYFKDDADGPTDTPSCGVGHAFFNLGVRGLPEELECTIATFNKRIHTKFHHLGNGDGTFTDLAGSKFRLDASATEIKRLHNFQDSQDAGDAWGKAVNELGAAYA